MSAEFVYWSFADVEHALVPDDLIGLDNAREKLHLITGYDYKGAYPTGLQFTASDDYPNNLLLPDTMGNTNSVFPVSKKIKDYLETLELPRVSFIPVQLLNHRGSVAGDYFLLHPIGPVDCMDWDASGAEVDDLNEEMAETVDQLVLDESKIPGDLPLFRVKGLYNVVVVARELADKLSEQQFSGLKWKPLEKYSY